MDFLKEIAKGFPLYGDPHLRILKEIQLQRDSLKGILGQIWSVSQNLEVFGELQRKC